MTDKSNRQLPSVPNAINTEKINSANSGSSAENNSSKSFQIEIPKITLPKGGGALKGIDEKFQINAANGTSGFNIPLPVSPGRTGFQPALSLSYNSGGGNSPFGLGWDIDLPAIQRKTDKQLPQYRNDPEEDVFMFSGAEDLVPYLAADGSPGVHGKNRLLIIQ